MRGETSDDELEARLRGLAAGIEPVPAELVAAASRRSPGATPMPSWPS
ncbi:MAG TPA: hypothetical protein VN767_22375 [Streptosporangiaceae bacterium]|nr:hypothetical protein [Streptosporangiaceae bacterium]